ncbi:Ig-like domain-containing protein, partial [Vibrio parahaemolyticus]|uniref:Ig-like domain-containing protein n=1 Tax=Vibrio parahaemolyticus TaxID=670 RepID=UPI002361CCE8
LDVTQDSAVSWRTSDTNVALVSNTMDSKGLVKALSPGNVEIIASGSANGQAFEASALLTSTNAVVTSLIVEPDSASLPVGLEQQYTAYVVLSDGNTLDVTQDSAVSWRTSDTNVALVSNTMDSKGLVKALSPGNVEIIASGSANGQAFEASAPLEVTVPILNKIILSSPEITITEYTGAQLEAFAHYSDGSLINITSLSTWSSGENLTVVNGFVSASPFIEGFISNVTASYDGIESALTDVLMEKAERSVVIGRETPYVNEISAQVHSELSFQGSAVLDGIYDAKSGNLLAGGYGGGLNSTDQELYSDNMLVDDVTFIEGIYGTAWGGSGGVPMLQVLSWQEGAISKKIGKLNSGSSIDVHIEDRILGIIVYSSSAVQPRYVTGIQFVYK